LLQGIGSVWFVISLHTSVVAFARRQVHVSGRRILGSALLDHIGTLLEHLGLLVVDKKQTTAMRVLVYYLQGDASRQDIQLVNQDNLQSISQGNYQSINQSDFFCSDYQP
jgi:hypothetical protein